ncbi:gamma carbonic anhydrase family protein [Amycolatopsis pithecellobii]|uniref:Gamma carbonic anhydrase family protein n=1 Tax=Amycolatopsis pithecellobii TaxID=664692 RepID=A0A6N7YVT8_9PSEU|nr:gamma carbonic anhydrase family protein [Amycolatopsis pithecellobii]MTD56052.1 gamma carbonic anhydrase family protein [Amycolatopsis pithecellobii]
MADLTFTLDGATPELAGDVFVAPTAALIGAVRIGPGASIWFGAVLRADQNRIEIGAGTNIQDNAVLHADPADYPGYPVLLGEDVTVGHGAVLHGCSVGSGALIGSGAIVLDGASIGAGALVAAGALVPAGREIEPGVLAVGSPAKVVRELTEQERAGLVRPPQLYRALAERYLRQGKAAAR